MKHTNHGPTPRTLSEAVFMDAGCAIERPGRRNRSSAWAIAAWALIMILGAVALAVIARV